MSSTVPPAGPSAPEYLEQDGGARAPRPGTGRRTALVAGGALLGLAVVGGGIWAATSFLGTGPQPAEALPDSTLGYASIDLDPSGGQKIEAVRMLREFPAFRDHLGLETDDDLRRRLFEEVGGITGCDGLDYADDVEPWLGNRAAVAVVDTGADRPAPVVVVQVTDEDRAEDGLAALRGCVGGDVGGWSIHGGWAVLAGTGALARGVADDAARASLADDEEYRRWTDEVGEAGIVNLYAAPEAGTLLSDGLGGVGTPFAVLSSDGAPAGATGRTLGEFRGGAATVRFHDGALELEVAGDPGPGQQALYASDRGDDVLATLPGDTAAAIGVGFEPGWFSGLVERMASHSGGGTDAAELMDELSARSGLDLPDDAETLAGTSTALAIGSDFDPEAFFGSTDGSGVPVAAKVQGDPDGVETVLDRLRGQVGPDGEAALGSDTEGDLVAIGPDPDYRARVLRDGTLGDSDVFADVVPDAGDAGAILFVDFDAGGGWLADLAGGDGEVADNLEPLRGLGLSVWQEDDAAHALLRLTTG